MSVICENDAKLSLPMHICYRRLVLYGAGSHKFVPVSVILNPACLDHIGSARSQFPSYCSSMTTVSCILHCINSLCITFRIV